MHELSVATALVAQAERAARAAGAERVVAVRLRLGRLSGLVPDSLQFGFEIAALGTSLEGARLEIERVDPVIWCPSCEAAVTLPSTTRFRCPDCDTPSADVLAGRELELRSLEVADPAVDPATVAAAAPSVSCAS
jgi:hydrogenase nickel incorporation protein HypA/HybF